MNFFQPISLLVIFGVACLSASAQMQITVGRGGIPWESICDSSSFVQIKPDSIWVWPTSKGENLIPESRQRGGGVYVFAPRPMQVNPDEFLEMQTLIATEIANDLIDGDLVSAFNPDEYNIERDAEIYIDLGGVFGVNRVRLYPRLDNEHVGLFPQSFEFGIGNRKSPFDFVLGILDQSFNNLIRYSKTRPNERAVIDWPGMRGITRSYSTRYIRFASLGLSPWELSEIEVYADGTVPTGLFVSTPILGSGGAPVWGRVQHIGDDSLENLPIVLQTRTGPDPEPLHYYVQSGERLRRETRYVWEAISTKSSFLGALEQGPVVPNPDWSNWETVRAGIVETSSPNRYLQFRLRLLEPGVRIESLVFDYATRPLVEEVNAEVYPTNVLPGTETSFILSLQIRRPESSSASGFRFINISTIAEIEGVDSVKVDDESVVFSTVFKEGAFDVNLWKRLIRDGSFVQLFFRASVYTDGTMFDVRLFDRRNNDNTAKLDTVYQSAREGDVDPVAFGNTLSVRLRDAEISIVGEVEYDSNIVTPNGDGVNDVLRLYYDIFKLINPAEVSFTIFNLDGLPVKFGLLGPQRSGNFMHVWDGRDEKGVFVGPGTYLCRLQVEADIGDRSHVSIIQVVY